MLAVQEDHGAIYPAQQRQHAEFPDRARVADSQAHAARHVEQNDLPLARNRATHREESRAQHSRQTRDPPPHGSHLAAVSAPRRRRAAREDRRARLKRPGSKDPGGPEPRSAGSHGLFRSTTLLTESGGPSSRRGTGRLNMTL